MLIEHLTCLLSKVFLSMHFFSSQVLCLSPLQNNVQLLYCLLKPKYIVMSNMIRETISIRFFFTLLDLAISWPLPIYCNNKSALNIASSDSIITCPKHIDIKYHFIQKQFQTRSFSASWILTTDMIANILTKSLFKNLHYKFVLALGLVSQSFWWFLSCIMSTSSLMELCWPDKMFILILSISHDY